MKFFHNVASNHNRLYSSQNLSYNNPNHGLNFSDLPYANTKKSNIFQGYKSFTDNLDSGRYFYSRSSDNLLLNNEPGFKGLVNMLLEDKKAPFYITGHANQLYMYQNDVAKSSDDLIKIILKSNYKPCTPIMLGGCHIGKNKYAQELADKLYVPVQAPTDYFFFTNTGTSRVSTSNKTISESALNDNLYDGYIKTFLPGNRTEKIVVILDNKTLKPINRNFTENLDFGTIDITSSNILDKVFASI